MHRTYNSTYNATFILYQLTTLSSGGAEMIEKMHYILVRDSKTDIKIPTIKKKWDKKIGRG